MFYISCQAPLLLLFEFYPAFLVVDEPNQIVPVKFINFKIYLGEKSSWKEGFQVDRIRGDVPQVAVGGVVLQDGEGAGVEPNLDGKQGYSTNRPIYRHIIPGDVTLQ